jgi:outer membrane protein TolC
VKIAIFTGWMILMSVGLAKAQEPPVVPYKEYLQEVLDYYPSLKKQYANIDKALSEKALAASSRMPHFWASADFQYGNDPVYVFGALLRQNKFDTDDFDLDRLNEPKSYANTTGSIQGQWLLFDFSQTASRIKSAGLLAESAHYQAEMTKMEAILAASEVYSRLGMTQDLLKVFDQVTNDGQADVSFAESLGTKGLDLGAAFYLARMTETKLLQTKNEIMAQAAALTMVFNILRGQDPAEPVRVDLDFNKEVHLNGDVQEWIAKALNDRLDIKAIAKELEAQGVEVNRERTSFLPQISAYGQAGDDWHGLNQSGGKNYVVGLKATMNIFDPGYSDRVKKARAETDFLKDQYQETKDHAAQDAAETFYELQALKSNSGLALKALEDAKQATALMAPLYKEGRLSIDQILSVRAGLVEAYEHWIRLENAYRQNILSLELYAGELDQNEAVKIYGPR